MPIKKNHQAGLDPETVPGHTDFMVTPESTDKFVEDNPHTDNKYKSLLFEEAHRALQTAIAYEIQLRKSDAHLPKSICTNLVVSQARHMALVQLLINTGIFTMSQYEEAVNTEMTKEVERYERQNNIVFR